MCQISIRSVSSNLILVFLAILGITTGQASSAITYHQNELDSLPIETQAAISAGLGQEQSIYHASQEGASLQFYNPLHGLKARFSSHGMQLENANAAFGMKIQSFGYGTHLDAVTSVEPQMDQNRIKYSHGDLEEWYVNGPSGLEQGFTITHPPGKSKNNEEITLTMALTGNLIAKSTNDGFDLLRPNGQVAMHYGGLIAYDAKGNQLPAKWHNRNNKLNFSVNDKGAQYPITIDPIFKQAKLSIANGVYTDRFGISVSASGDTVVIGAESASVGTHLYQGAAYVFVKPASGWVNTTSYKTKLVAPDGKAGDGFGASVSMHGDTVVVGTSFISPGSAYVFVKPAAGWSNVPTFKAKLRYPRSGDKRAISIYGNTIVTAGDNSNINSSDAVYVFEKPASGWLSFPKPNAVLSVPISSSTAYRFGSSLSIYENTIAVGGRDAIVNNKNSPGSVFLFEKPATGWASTNAYKAKLSANDSGINDHFGDSVSLSGATLIVGAPNDTIGTNQSQGSAYVFVKPTTGWASTSTFKAKLTASDGKAFDLYGISVAQDGDKIVVGASRVKHPSALFDSGVAYIYYKPLASWVSTSKYTNKFVASDGSIDGQLGTAVSASNNIVIAGAPLADSKGAAYIFGPDCRGLSATIIGTSGNDNIIGTEGRDIIAGLGGNDTIQGKGGDDLICAGAGNDTVLGGIGDDVIHGEDGLDNLSGSEGNDILLGGGNSDTLHGDNGIDKCIGGLDIDTATLCETLISVP